MNPPEHVPGLPLESKAAAGNPGVGARVFARIFSRHILNAALLVLLALYATGFLTRPELPQGDSDDAQLHSHRALLLLGCRR